MNEEATEAQSEAAQVIADDVAADAERPGKYAARPWKPYVPALPAGSIIPFKLIVPVALGFLIALGGLEGLAHWPIDLRSHNTVATNGGTNGGTVVSGNQPESKPKIADDLLKKSLRRLWKNYLALEKEKTKSAKASAIEPVATIEFSLDTETTATSQPLRQHSKTTQLGSSVETTLMADGTSCTMANGTTNRFKRQPLTLDVVQPWALLAGYTAATYDQDAALPDHTDWVVNVTLPNPPVPGRTFSLNTAKVMINPKHVEIEEIDQHATWTDSLANIHQPAIHRDLTATLTIQ
jgi:hypothetical protein